MSSQSNIIGVDESGKGDFLGPLVVASLLAGKSEEKLLQSLGVRDGKTLSVKRTHEIASDLKNHFPYALVVWMPREYNRLYKEIKNLNKLLAEGHSQAIVKILVSNKADMAVSDKFGKEALLENALAEKKCNISLKQLVRGESILQVAAASIIARSEFIQRMDQLSEEYEIELPRGASKLVDEAAVKFIERYSLKSLEAIAKTHFKNYQRVIKPGLFI